MTERIIERVIGSMRDDLAARLAAGNPPEAGLSVMMLEPAQGPAGDVVLVHARNVVVAPALGLVLDGRTCTALFAPAAQVPDAAIARTQARAARAGNLPRIARAALWCGAGAARNYGHFIFDGLTGLAAMDSRGLLTRYPPLDPRLTRWQRELRALAGLPASPGTTIRAPLIRVDELIYTDCLNYYLHRAGGLFAALAARFDAARSEIGAEAGAGAGGEEVVYLSRRGFTGRIVVNEHALERALAARGARVLRPERLSVAAQAHAMARARLVIGASGAGLANMAFMAPGAGLLELRPDPVREPWMALASAARGIGHDVLALEGPLPRAEIPAVQRLRQWPRRLTGRYHYALKADIDAVLARIG